MSKEQENSNKEHQKKSLRKSNFGNRRDNYVDSFRWGFVEGTSDHDDQINDDDIYRGEKNSPKTNQVPSTSGHLGSAPSQQNDKKRTKRSKRKATNESPFVDSFVKNDEIDSDDDDLNLPSYGRTPVPSDKEIPVPVKTKHSAQRSKSVQKQTETKENSTNENSSKFTAQNRVDSKQIESNHTATNRVEAKHESVSKRTSAVNPANPISSDRHKKTDENFVSSSQETRQESTGFQGVSRPRKEQMVWDPDKCEYVPLIVSELKKTHDGKIEKPASKIISKNEPKNGKFPEKSWESRDNEDTPRKRFQHKPEKKSLPEKPKDVSTNTTKYTEHPAKLPVNSPSEKSEHQTKTPEQFVKNKQRDKKPRIGISETKNQQQLPASNSADKQSDQKRTDRHYSEQQQSDKKSHSTKYAGPKPEKSVLSNSERRPHEKESKFHANRGGVPQLVESKTPDPADRETDATGFAALGVSDVMLEALTIVRYSEPTPIQAGVFKQVQAGTDVMGQAQTGTGKTAAFLIPLIEGVEDCPPGNDPVALILVPTRELAVQVRDEAVRLSYGRDLRISACYGGKPIAKQMARLKDGTDIVVGTPGRILDLMRRHALTMTALKWVVLDEADRMLDIGFRPDIEKILKQIPQKRQTLLFSATLPPQVVKLAEQYMNSPEILDFSSKGVSVETIEQFYVTVDPERKFDALRYLLEEEQPHQAIIFTRTKRGADRLARLLSKQLDSLAAIHGDLSQGERDRVMSQFRSGNLRYLVATDVVGRGIDVSGISHIINYDIPKFCDDYVHRVGRTGRMGREGVAFTFVTVEEGSELTRIEVRIEKLLKRAELKGFESFAKPIDSSSNAPEQSQNDAKPVYGKSVRKTRRAL
ncbi:MAG: DEAD/DEAH box helicase [Thermoguttaceae bacterium]